MKERLRDIADVMRERRGIFERLLFPVVLCLYPFIGVLQGIDITDTTYSLGNYQYMDLVDPMWVIATYLPHVTGRLFMHLPFGNTMAGLRVYCTLFICITAISAYFLLKRFLPQWMAFIGLFLAESLYWCPRTILYNTMTYLFFTLGTLTLLRALTNETEKSRTFFLAGIFFGLNVTVRLPNIVHVLMIILVFVYGRETGRDILHVCKQVLLCVAGFFAGFLVPFIAICIRFGSYAYSEMVIGLFTMSETAREYTLSQMILSTLRAYAATITHMSIFIPCIAAGVLLFSLRKEKGVMWKKIIFVAGLLVLLRFYVGRGVITMNYWYYDCMFQAAMMFVIVACILFILDLLHLIRGSAADRILSLAALLSVILLPIGSNNYTFPVIGCLFVIAPAALSAFRRARKTAYKSDYALQHFTWISTVFGLLIVLSVQGVLFHVTFSFRDGMDGTARNTRITEIPKLNGMVTTEENADRLTALYAFLREEDLTGREVIAFGDIPGISYLFDMPPALFTLWPDLESNVTERFDEALSTLTDSPIVIVRPAGTDMYAHSERKYTLLLFYMEQNGYETVYDGEDFKVYVPTEGQG